MIFNPLGRTDIKVSSMCLGTMTWGSQNTQDDDAVICHIDT
jgi:aryl-alcohol dehydrogenase-like predicted oxidoreductase